MINIGMVIAPVQKIVLLIFYNPDYRVANQTIDSDPYC